MAPVLSPREDKASPITHQFLLPLSTSAHKHVEVSRHRLVHNTRELCRVSHDLRKSRASASTVGEVSTYVAQLSEEKGLKILPLSASGPGPNTLPGLPRRLRTQACSSTHSLPSLVHKRLRDLAEKVTGEP